jgi:hypothetical protein
MFTVNCTSDKIWNTTELVAFLAANQHKSIVLDINPEAICLHNLGLYKILECFEFEQVFINTWNPFEQHLTYKIKHKGNNFWFGQVADIDPELHSWNLTKQFLCFYHRPTAARLGLAAYLKTKHNKSTVLHFSAKDHEDFELDKLLQWDRSTVSMTASIIPELPILLDSDAGYTKFNGYVYSDPLTNLYKDILVDMVVESHVAGNTFFPTEKTVRPMLLKKPFIMFGSRNYLEHMRQMGFRTFADFWDEDYDGYEGADRLHRIQQLIDSIASMPIKQLESMYWDMQYTLDHNYKLLMTKTYTNKVTPL